MQTLLLEAHSKYLFYGRRLFAVCDQTAQVGPSLLAFALARRCQNGSVHFELTLQRYADRSFTAASMSDPFQALHRTKPCKNGSHALTVVEHFLGEDAVFELVLEPDVEVKTFYLLHSIP